MEGFTALEQTIGWGWFLYCVALSIGCVLIHHGFLAVYLLTGLPKSAGHRFLELSYGLVNPVAYLLIFQPALFRSWTPTWLMGAQWISLVAYWLLRLLGALAPPSIAVRRRVLAVCAVIAGGTALRDAIFAIHTSRLPEAIPGALAVLPLYLFPLGIAWRQMDPAFLADRGGFLFESSRTQAASLALVGFIGGVIVPSLGRPGDEAARMVVASHHLEIQLAAKEAQIEPRTLAAIVFVTQRDLVSPFRLAVEHLTLSAWMTDKTSHILMSRLDPSLGLAQVKPSAMIDAVTLFRGSVGAHPYLSKEYRDVPESIYALAKSHPYMKWSYPEPPMGREATKAKIVSYLQTSDGNLRSAAWLLNVFATQWEKADSKWSIRDRPEILATLFQIGLERSSPKGNPVANSFGEAVREAYSSDWLRLQFPEAPKHNPIASE